MVFKCKGLLGCALAAAAWTIPLHAPAALLGGSDVTFIFDEDQLADSSPSVVGNTIEFELNGADRLFSRSSGAPDSESGSLFLQVSADPLIRISGVTLFASGEYETNGTTVDAAGSLVVDGVTAPAGPAAPFDGNTGALADWTGGAVSGPLDDQFLNVFLEGTLSADGFGGDLAFIDLQFVSLTIDTVVVPVPAAVWLLGSALLGLVPLARAGAR